MKKAIVMTLCAAMAVGMIGSVSTVYAADADIASDDAILATLVSIPETTRYTSKMSIIVALPYILNRIPIHA